MWRTDSIFTLSGECHIALPEGHRYTWIRTELGQQRQDLIGRVAAGPECGKIVILPKTLDVAPDCWMLIRIVREKEHVLFGEEVQPVLYINNHPQPAALNLCCTFSTGLHRLWIAKKNLHTEFIERAYNLLDQLDRNLQVRPGPTENRLKEPKTTAVPDRPTLKMAEEESEEPVVSEQGRYLANLLRSHNWNYQAAGTREDYVAGEQSWVEVIKAFRNCDQVQRERLWNRYAPRSLRDRFPILREGSEISA